MVPPDSAFRSDEVSTRHLRRLRTPTRPTELLGYTSSLTVHGHERAVLGAAPALAPDRGVALAAVFHLHGGGRLHRAQAAADRHARAVLPGALHLLVRESVPDRRGGALARTAHGRAAGHGSGGVVPAREPL